MKIGIFGDSYADPNPNPDFSWYHYLMEMLKPEMSANFGRAGTSQWWSYQKFLNNYTNFDTIVFVHTNPYRWPHLEKELTGYHWDITSRSYGGTPEALHQMNKFFLDIFSDELLTFLNYQVFKDINDRCEEKNIKLVNIIMHDHLSDVDAKYPILGNVDQLSMFESVTYKGDDYNFIELLTKLKIHDVRANHLSPSNNKLLAGIIADKIQNNAGCYIKLIDANVAWNTHDTISEGWV